MLTPRAVHTHIPIPAIAVVCHEANRAYCLQLGDDSQKPWDEAADWQRDSAIKGVEYALTHPDAKPSDQHDAWRAQKAHEGWVHGPVKNAETKEHPCMVDYDQLPVEQQIKDKLFRAIVDVFQKAPEIARG